MKGRQGSCLFSSLIPHPCQPGDSTMPAIARVDPKTHATAGRTLTVDPANMLVRAVISTAAPDRAGDVILPAGLRNADEFLRGWPVGFVPARALPIPATHDRPAGGTCYPEWDLLEYSAVPVPENPQALTLAVRKGLVKDAELRHWLVRDVLGGLFG